MQLQRERNTQPEVTLRRALWVMGYRYRVHHRALPDVRREVDIAFTRVRLAVFVDGCFWHGCSEHRGVPKTNSDWWRDKLESNRARDASTNQMLRAAAWTVLRIWEHVSLEEALAHVVSEIDRLEGQHSGSRTHGRGRRAAPPAGSAPAEPAP